MLVLAILYGEKEGATPGIIKQLNPEQWREVMCNTITGDRGYVYAHGGMITSKLTVCHTAVVSVVEIIKNEPHGCARDELILSCVSEIFHPKFFD